MNRSKSLKKRKYTRNRRRVQLLIMMVCFLICIGTVMHISATKIGAESDISKITYKYYKSYYVEDGDTLWSIAKAHISDEYPDVDAYITEVKNINGLYGNDLKQGSHICIPYYSMEHK